ncbi:hypothetical protein BpHYR1_017232 [Brachionus plicatilis]|uniref:Uncharacterized protein n=1 Tax=Brachionus plicatilis TaxID=10195 RepID=A0A3M7Q658_BRAPC|nr:hypothetical protein BpHYR1_017232 [Brachionus plicatilis]
MRPNLFIKFTQYFRNNPFALVSLRNNTLDLESILITFRYLLELHKDLLEIGKLLIICSKKL